MDDISSYVTKVGINPDFVSLRNTKYRIGSVSPSGQGRFHRPGQIAYYAASGDATAAAELLGDPDSPVSPPNAPFNIPSGDYRICDFQSYLAQHPEHSPEFFSQHGDRGWGTCQAVRDELEAMGCSGVLYPSNAHPGGINIAVWPLDGTPLTNDFFSKRNDE